MKVATTIQISSEENKYIINLQQALDAPSKKAVVLRALELLAQTITAKKRTEHLKKLSKKIGKHSLETNEEWTHLPPILTKNW